MKRRRQQAILELVRREPLASQQAILDRLRELGYEVTQPTVSRDLDELGLTRVRDASGHLRYASPQDAAPVGRKEELRHVLQEFVLGIVASGNLVVVRTPPGAANAVAQVLDRVEITDVVGTVAGDDTILVVAREGVRGRTVQRRLERLAQREAG
ncbi:MAG TPA: arginine repressor [Actinomycetota bacterium]|nr:arginine repressor [Actinomycetota bacterium]